MKKAEKKRRQSYTQVYENIVEKSKRGTKEDIEYLLSLYIVDNVNLSKMAKQALLKTKGNVQRVVLEQLEGCRGGDPRRWMRLSALGLRLNAALFLEDFVNAYEGNYQDVTFTKNINNIDWTNEKVLKAAVRLLDVERVLPKCILSRLSNKVVQDEAILIAKKQVENGVLSIAYLDLIAHKPEILRDSVIQNVIVNKVKEYFLYGEIRSLYKFIDFNEECGKSLLISEHDLGVIYCYLVNNVIGLNIDDKDYGNADVELVWRCITGKTFGVEEAKCVEAYLYSLEENVMLGQQEITHRHVNEIVSFINLLNGEYRHRFLKTIFEIKGCNLQSVEDSLAKCHDEDIYRIWIKRLSAVENLSLVHQTAKKLITFYPEWVKDILKEVKATGNENFYKNVEMMADKISVDVPEVEKKEGNEKEEIFTVDFLSDKEMTFLRKLCE